MSDSVQIMAILSITSIAIVGLVAAIMYGREFVLRIRQGMIHIRVRCQNKMNRPDPGFAIENETLPHKPDTCSEKIGHESHSTNSATSR